MGGSVFDSPADEGGKSSAGNSSHPHTERVTFFPPWPQGAVCRSIVLRPGIEPVPPAVEARSLHQWTHISSRESCFTCRRIKCAPRAELAHPDSTALGGTLVHLEAGCWVCSCGVAGRGGRRCGRGSCQAQVGEGGGGRRDVAQMTGQSLLQGHASILGKERTPSPVEASLRLGQWLEGLD